MSGRRRCVVGSWYRSVDQRFRKLAEQLLEGASNITVWVMLDQAWIGPEVSNVGLDFGSPECSMGRLLRVNTGLWPTSRIIKLRMDYLGRIKRGCSSG